MVELKGSLAAIGLPAIVQLIGELHHSGTLELSKNSGAHGILGFDDGRLVSAEFEVERGMSALETCVHELADANFRFVEGVAAGEHTLDIPAPELQELIVRAANREPVTEPPAAISGDELRAAGVCPRLGFADDPARHYSRPTALHRCYASESPSLVTNQEQLDLCLGGLYPTCARFRNAARSKSLAAPAALPPRDDRDAEERAKANVRADSARVAAADHSTPGADRTTPARVSQQHRAATDTHDDDAPSGAARLRNVIGGLAAGRGLAALVGLIGVVLLVALPALGGGGAPTRQPASNPAAAALVTATAAPPASVAAAQATALAAIGAAQTTALAPAAAAQPTAAVAQTSAAAQAATQATRAAPAAAASPTTAPPLAPTPARLATPTTAPLANAAGARSLMDVRFAAGPANNWLENPPVASWSDGAYRLQTRQPAQFVAIAVPLVQITSDVVVSATFRKTGGPPGGGYGVIVRDQGPLPRDGLNQEANAYVFEAGDLGEFGVWRRVGDHWVDLVPWTRSSSVRPGGSPNDLLVRAIGDSLSFIINGARVASVQDDALPSGGVGAFVGGDYNEVALDHFAVQLPD